MSTRARRVLAGDARRLRGSSKLERDLTPICYSVLSTNPPTSVFAGPIDSSSDPTLVGQYYVIEVVDSTPEQIGVEYTTKISNCTNIKVSPLYTVTGGSLTVR